MRIGYQFALWMVVALLAIPAVAGAQRGNDAQDLAPLDATITLGRSPEPPDCAQPQDDVDIWWDITYSTTPAAVIYTLVDPDGATIDSTYYPGDTGVSINRQWTVPFDPVIGKYWVRVEFHSNQSGHEATAEVSFYVCSGIGEICAQKWVDANCDGVGQLGEEYQGWWICIETPWGDTFCDTTDATGEVCWDKLPLGTYTVYEIINPPWVPIFPVEREVTITDANPSWSGAFFNVNYDECYGACCKCDGECVEVTPAACSQFLGAIFMGLGSHCDQVQCGEPSAVEKTTWGAVKDKYR